MRLYVNDIELDLPTNFKIARTKQVNTIGSLNDRQVDYTNRFKLPKTKNNIKALNHLSLVGSTSKIPYQRNSARLFNDNGECEIFDGYAVVQSSNDDEYDMTIYDGYISFTKAIEKSVITDVGLSELNHIKNLASVTNTWNGITDYRYNIADYNGKMVFDNGGTPTINLDYLIPSVNKKYLWDKIFNYYGFTYSGSVFDTEDFINNWLTYPKAIGDGTQVTTFIHQWHWEFSVAYLNPSGQIRYSDYFTHDPLVNNSYATSSPETVLNEPEGSVITVTQAGLYKFVFDGYITKAGEHGQQSDVPLTIKKGYLGSGVPFETQIVKDDVVFGETFTVTAYVSLEAGMDFVITGARPLYSNITGENFDGDLDIDFSIVEGNQVDFEEAFIDLSVKDFVNEILYEFSLTPFKDKYTNHIEFLTHEEWLQNTDVDDWSSNQKKFVKKENEEYIIGDYAQRNYLRHRYNDDNADYNDGILGIANVNLKESTDVISSKIYTVEQNKTQLINYYYNVYKFWDKEVKDDGSVKYKDLNKRFCFQRSHKKLEALNIGSETLVESAVVTEYYSEGYERLPFKEIVDIRYLPMYSILNTSKLIDASIYLNDTDIHKLDFKKLVYIKELGSYYMKNKIPNYFNKGVYNTELIEVDFGDTESELPPPQPYIVIDSEASEPDGITIFNWRIITDYVFYNYFPISATITAVQYDEPDGTPTGHSYSNSVVVSNNVHVFDLPIPLGTTWGWYKVKIVDSAGLESNIDWVYVEAPPADLEPSINVLVEGSSVVDTSVPLLRDVTYRFNNFTPSTATLKAQKIDLFTGQNIGTATTTTLTTLTPDVDNVLTDYGFHGGAGYYKILLTTDTLIFNVNTFVF